MESFVNHRIDWKHQSEKQFLHPLAGTPHEDEQLLLILKC